MRNRKLTADEIDGLKSAVEMFAASRGGEVGPVRYHPMNRYAEGWLTRGLNEVPQAVKVRAYFDAIAAEDNQIPVYAIKINGGAVEGARLPYVV